MSGWVIVTPPWKLPFGHSVLNLLDDYVRNPDKGDEPSSCGSKPPLSESGKGARVAFECSCHLSSVQWQSRDDTRKLVSTDNLVSQNASQNLNLHRPLTALTLWPYWKSHMGRLQWTLLVELSLLTVPRRHQSPEWTNPLASKCFEWLPAMPHETHQLVQTRLNTWPTKSGAIIKWLLL